MVEEKLEDMLGKVKAILKDKGYVLYQRPYELNIVGLRSKQTKANSFDDEIHVFYKVENGQWHYHIYRATTDPGTYWLKNPSIKKGTAILSAGQYRNTYGIGLHQGKYEALVQLKPVNVIRDYDRDAILDLRNGTREVGMLGINIHHAKSRGKTFSIDKYSAGCQVFQSADDFTEFITLCKMHKSLYGNQFTYTLVDFRAARRITYKRVAMAFTFIMSLIAGFVLKEENKEGRTK